MSGCRWLCPVFVMSAALWAVPACGGDDDDGNGDGGDGSGSNVDSGAGGAADSGTGTGVDSGTGTGVDASADCPVAASLGPLDPLPQQLASNLTQSEDPAVRFLSVLGIVDQDDTIFDVLFIELWDGLGPFAGGQLAAGNYTIQGVDATLVGCGVCVLMLGNAQIVNGQVLAEKEYIATAGTVTVDSAGTRVGNNISGNYTGTASDLVLAEIDPNDDQGGALAGGCETAIDRVTWDAVIENGDATP